MCRPHSTKRRDAPASCKSSRVPVTRVFADTHLRPVRLNPLVTPTEERARRAMAHWSFPQIPGAVALRDFCASDISDAYLETLNDPTWMTYSTRAARRTTPDEAQEFLQQASSGSNFLLASCDPLSGSVVGTVGIVIDDHSETAEMGMLIFRGCGRRGFGLSTWAATLSSLLSRTQLRKIFAGTATTNMAMRTILSRCHMSQEATLPKHVIVEGKPTDVLFFSIFRTNASSAVASHLSRVSILKTEGQA